MAQKVFNAAADPNVFPDQIAAGLLPWKPLKVYARVPFARVGEKASMTTQPPTGSQCAFATM